MKAAKVLGAVEHQISLRLTQLLNAAWKRYGRLTRSAATISDAGQQRRYIRRARRTLSNAEKIIAQMKRRIVTAEKYLAGGKKRRARPVKRKAKRRMKRAATRASRKKRG
jgi:hypothetical protein